MRLKFIVKDKVNEKLLYVHTEEKLEEIPKNIDKQIEKLKEKYEEGYVVIKMTT